jgi:hypothetical protein
MAASSGSPIPPFRSNTIVRIITFSIVLKGCGSRQFSSLVCLSEQNISETENVSIRRWKI